MEVTGPSAPIAAVACMHCRRLKMKCIGSENPPCARCAKAGRDCIVQKPDRTQASSNLRPGASHGASSSLYRGTVSANDNTTPVWRKDGYGAAIARNFFPHNTEPADKESALPSIYTTTPYTTVFGSTEQSPEDTSGQSSYKRRRIEVSLERSQPQSGVEGRYPFTESAPIPERDMIQLLDIFRNRMLVFIPLLERSVLDDIPSVISEKRTLALSICYVTARYVPGGDRTRSNLIPAISDILQDRNYRSQTDEEKWTMLQALSILYAYRPTVHQNTSGHGYPDISHRSIKGYAESYALHLSVHRSITGLKASIRANEPHITSTRSFKYYIYWLWLFNMSNHYSVATGTPPSIHIDATIRAAPQLLENIDIGHGPRQILAEAELCIHWDKISAHSPALAEWGCPPDIIDDNSGAMHPENLRNLDLAVNKSLDAWTRKWGSSIPNEPLGQAMDFHYRFTKFCLSTYMIRNLSIGLNLNNDQQYRLNNSVQAAHHFCEHLLGLGPAERDAARYMGDFGFVMVSFSCLFIVEVCRSYRTILHDIDHMIGTVEEVALLMKQLAISPSADYGPALQANIVLQKLHELGIMIVLSLHQ